MPGFSKLEDKEFLRAFQVTDGVIQNNQPLFMLTWVGSIISVLSVMAISILSLGVSEAWIIFVVGLIYLLGVQGITVSIHLPLNNHIQNFDKIYAPYLNFENQLIQFIYKNSTELFTSKCKPVLR